MPESLSNPESLLHRPLHFTLLEGSFAAAAVQLQAGKTLVHCTACLEDTVPAWLKGRGQGWLAAEYSMLPGSTPTRSKRERNQMSGRTHEIQRLIGRAIRQMVNLSHLKDKTLVIDCDVLQADGGTRTMCINAASVAVSIALRKSLQNGKISVNPLKDMISAISIGCKKNTLIADLNYEQDSTIDVDGNFVFNSQFDCIEVQIASEKAPFSQATLSEMIKKAAASCESIQKAQRAFLSQHEIV